MNYQFPTITHIDECLAVIKDKPEFIHVIKDGYQVINYVMVSNDTFPPVQTKEEAILRECRGIKFDLDGKIIQRPLHKFFNIGEKEETFLNNIDFTQHHVVMEKLDGSMVIPIWINGVLRLTTKMGITDTSMQAEKFIASRIEYKEFFRFCKENKWTPIFEWCSNKQRIVVDHPNDKLVLLHIRDLYNGKYYERYWVNYYADLFTFPTVETFDSVSGDALEYMETLRSRDDIEGIVIQVSGGHMVKIKTDWYLRLHKVKDEISSERKMVNLILSSGLDDLKPLMDKSDFDKVVEYEVKFIKQLDTIATSISNFAIIYKENYTRKEFALGPYKTIEPLMGSLIFKVWDFPSVAFAYDYLIEVIKKNLGSNKRFAELKNTFFSDIKYLEVGEE